MRRRTERFVCRLFCADVVVEVEVCASPSSSTSSRRGRRGRVCRGQQREQVDDVNLLIATTNGWNMSEVLPSS